MDCSVAWNALLLCFIAVLQCQTRNHSTVCVVQFTAYSILVACRCRLPRARTMTPWRLQRCVPLHSNDFCIPLCQPFCQHALNACRRTLLKHHKHHCVASQLNQPETVDLNQSNHATPSPVLQEALEARKEHAIMVVGRLAVFGAAGRQQPWLAAQLLSHFVGHGAGVEAAIKDISRCAEGACWDPSMVPGHLGGSEPLAKWLLSNHRQLALPFDFGCTTEQIRLDSAWLLRLGGRCVQAAEKGGCGGLAGAARRGAADRLQAHQPLRRTRGAAPKHTPSPAYCSESGCASLAVSSISSSPVVDVVQSQICLACQAS